MTAVYYRKSGARPGTAESKTLKGLAYDGGQLKKVFSNSDNYYICIAISSTILILFSNKKI